MFFRERFIFFSVLGFIAACSLLKNDPDLKKVSLSSFLPKFPPAIDILILGAVDRPGLYKIESGSSIQEILKKARLKKSADISSLLVHKKVFGSTCIYIPEKKQRKNKKKKVVSSRMVSALSKMSDFKSLFESVCLNTA